MPMIDSFGFRHEKYLEMICVGMLEPEKLPPSERAAHYHGLRVHLQVIEWKVLDASANFNVEEWGWRIENDCFNPVTTDKPVAPDNVLKVIRCKCKSTSKNQCGSNVCTCRKNGLKCMNACGGCHGENCKNKLVSE